MFIFGCLEHEANVQSRAAFSTSKLGNRCRLLEFQPKPRAATTPLTADCKLFSRLVELS